MADLSNKTNVEGADLVPDKGTALYWDDKLPGFGLRVSAGGVRAYIAQARVNGKSRRVTIGKHGVFTPAQARKEARGLLGEMSKGNDPVEQRQRRKAAALTLREVSEDYCENHRRKKDSKPLAPRSKKDIRSHVAKAFSDWADKPVAAINRDMVRKRYARLAEKSQAQANQAMRVLSSLINYARATTKASDGEYVIRDNPVAVLHEASVHLGEVEGRKIKVPHDKIGLFLGALERARKEGAPVTRTKAAAAYVLALTGLRKADVVNRRWDEIDLDACTLHVPDTKHRTPRTFPLASQVVDALRDLQPLTGGSRFVFAGSNGKKPIQEIRAGLAPAIHATGAHVAAHDLRRTWIDAVKATKTDSLVAELLANRKGAQFQALSVRFENYDNNDLMDLRPEAQAIADWFSEQARIAESDNIVMLEARA